MNQKDAKDFEQLIQWFLSADHIPDYAKSHVVAVLTKKKTDLEGLLTFINETITASNYRLQSDEILAKREHDMISETLLFDQENQAINLQINIVKEYEKETDRETDALIDRMEQYTQAMQ